MRKVLLFTALGMALVPAAFPAVCPNGPYSLYLVPNFTCTLGNLTFKSFGYVGTASPGTFAIPASGVLVTTITTPGNEGFQFGVSMSVATSGVVNSFQDALITFIASAPSPTITGLQLSFDGSFTGSGATGVAETYCINGDFLGCPTGLKQISVTNPPQNLATATTFSSPATSISLSKDINATSGVNGTAAISRVINTFPNSIPVQPTGVPLPPSLLLTLTGLAASGLYAVRGKFSRRS